MPRHDTCNDWAEDKLMQYVVEKEIEQGPLHELPINAAEMIFEIMTALDIDELYFPLLIGEHNYRHLVERGLVMDRESL